LSETRGSNVTKTNAYKLAEWATEKDDDGMSVLDIKNFRWMIQLRRKGYELCYNKNGYCSKNKSKKLPSGHTMQSECGDGCEWIWKEGLGPISVQQ
jgi:hypothetical protein